MVGVIAHDVQKSRGIVEPLLDGGHLPGKHGGVCVPHQELRHEGIRHRDEPPHGSHELLPVALWKGGRGGHFPAFVSFADVSRCVPAGWEYYFLNIISLGTWPG